MGASTHFAASHALTARALSCVHAGVQGPAQRRATRGRQGSWVGEWRGRAAACFCPSNRPPCPNSALPRPPQTATDVRKTMTNNDFSREINILRACRDTNILQFQGVCFQDGRTLLVTECEWLGARGQRAVLPAAGPPAVRHVTMLMPSAHAGCADMEGGNLAQNLRAKKVTWWRRGKKVGAGVPQARTAGCQQAGASLAPRPCCASDCAGRGSRAGVPPLAAHHPP